MAVGDQGDGAALGGLSTPNLTPVMPMRSFCHGCATYQVFWVDSHPLVLLTTADERRHVQVVRLDLRTRHQATSRTVHLPVVIGHSQEPLT